MENQIFRPDWKEFTEIPVLARMSLIFGIALLFFFIFEISTGIKTGEKFGQVIMAGLAAAIMIVYVAYRKIRDGVTITDREIIIQVSSKTSVIRLDVPLKLLPVWERGPTAEGPQIYFTRLSIQYQQGSYTMTVKLPEGKKWVRSFIDALKERTNVQLVVPPSTWRWLNQPMRIRVGSKWANLAKKAET